ncbi:4-carboxymuconolactone decarboxylase [Vibrio cholerae]|nr:4-carboxymuconolactone decarboxylase [Vibrio cholerae HE-25]EMQ66375.1 4-carboxymuconolactone decarboxylase [Vibrio cholerae O1 str. NHCC-008D]GHW67034.1 4-carboxymuconolactone decarboxylase [Vibrio cholerae]GHX62660.1 4-carboxymuconolactone decarboxylase [Vibrio cholerae]
MSHHPADRRSQVLSSLQEWSSVSCFPLGEINQAYANYFSGISYLALLNQTDLPVF